MKKSKSTDQLIAFALKQSETRTPVTSVCRKLGISQQTFSPLNKNLAGLGTEELRRLKHFEEENRRSKSLVAELGLHKQLAQDVLSKSSEACLTS